MKAFVAYQVAVCLLVAISSSWAVPEQVKISLNRDPTQMVVYWATWADTVTSVVNWWPKGSTGVNFTATESAPPFRYEYLPNYTSPAFHVATMINLTSNTFYEYNCGDATDGWSQVFEFYTGFNPNGPLRIAQIADHGATVNSAQNVVGLVNQHQISPYSFLIFSGDVSYANGWQPIWDDWGNLAQPATAVMPWMMSVGNHESYDLYVSYLYRFVMPASPGPRNMHYSFDFANVHVIALNSELTDNYGMDFQYYWLENDLQNVDRSVTPWIIAMWHTPWYCTNAAHYLQGEPMRKSYEILFYQYYVDLVVNGHIHAYQRTLPVFNGTVNPNGTVYITSGVGGNGEGLYTTFVQPDPAWSAFYNAVFGFGSIEIHNATHMYWNMRRANDSAIFDETWIVRTRAPPPSTTNVQTSGVQTSGAQTTNVQTTAGSVNVQTTGVQTTGIQSSPVKTTGDASALVPRMIALVAAVAAVLALVL